MPQTLLLVDYENTGKIDLHAIPEEIHVRVFFGASQKTVPTEFLKAALRLGSRFESIDIAGTGKNALDFHIAFYLGEFLTIQAQTRCVILSKDTGFDPLIKHLNTRGFEVRRTTALDEAFGSVVHKSIATLDWQSASAWLAAMQKNKRPRKRKGLAAHLHSHFGKKSSPSEIESWIDKMITEQVLSVTDDLITYKF